MNRIYSSSPAEQIQKFSTCFSDHLAFQAIITGHTNGEGEIWGNPIDEPEVILAFVKHRYYLASIPGADLPISKIRDLFFNTIYLQAKSRAQEILMLYFSDHSQKNILVDLFKNITPVLADREYYELSCVPLDGQFILPPGVEIHRVDRELFNQNGLANLDLLSKEMCSERRSVNDFLDNSLGVCAISSGAIIGWCLSEYNTENRCEIGIETLPGFQHRGIGSALTGALAQLLFSQGFSKIGWHCFKKNIPSSKTALRAGFEKKFEYPVFICPVK